MKDLTGQRFGRLVAVKYEYQKNGRYLWLFKCDCGNEKIIGSNNVKNGHTLSCGCLKKELLSKTYTKHGEGSRGKGETREYRIWLAMRSRCLNKKTGHYKNYGGRGITICKRWADYKLFIKDMGRCPDGYTIERIDNNKGYSPNNCKWASCKEQARNRRTTRLLSNGAVTMCLKDWSSLLNVQERVLRKYLKDGNSINDL